jgi:hypothetical protein
MPFDNQGNRVKFQRDDEGNVVNPPVIPEFERRTQEAQALGDTALIQTITDEYTEARNKVAEENDKQVDSDNPKNLSSDLNPATQDNSPPNPGKGEAPDVTGGSVEVPGDPAITSSAAGNIGTTQGSTAESRADAAAGNPGDGQSEQSGNTNTGEQS